MNGGNRGMSATLEWVPTMFDCPAKINTRNVLVSASAHRPTAGTRRRAVRTRSFIVIDLCRNRLNAWFLNECSVWPRQSDLRPEAGDVGHPPIVVEPES